MNTAQRLLHDEVSRRLQEIKPGQEVVFRGETWTVVRINPEKFQTTYTLRNNTSGRAFSLDDYRFLLGLDELKS